MKLQLTIQEIQDPETLLTYKGVFGTLTVNLPDKKGKEKEERISFTTNSKAIPGFDKIIEGLVISTLELRKRNKEDKTVKTGDITIPNRAERRKKDEPSKIPQGHGKGRAPKPSPRRMGQKDVPELQGGEPQP